ncbi:MAG TPA: rhomboid family intramembrane serine protease [Longimicrobiaceae bacterium]|nr:rhomboid family intramembrane serine protease [Longimicrobiaceae bacterium]
MAYATNRFENPFGFTVTPWVKRLLIANVAVGILSLLLGLSGASGVVESALGLVPAEVWRRPWTIVTYMFVHAGFLHLLFNMLGLFFFGPPLEERWGGREFLKFYFIAGLGAALLSFITPHALIVGASGAIYGILMAYALYWPDNPVYIWGIFPVKVKWLVTGIVAITVLGALSSGKSGIAYLAHLGGLATGFLYLKSPWAPSAWGAVPRAGRKKSKATGGGLTFGWLKRDKTSRPPAAPTPQKPAGGTIRPKEEQQLLDDVDRILEKISARGLGSLTEEERKRLDEVSRRYRSN